MQLQKSKNNALQLTFHKAMHNFVQIFLTYIVSSFISHAEYVSINTSRVHGYASRKAC